MCPQIARRSLPHQEAERSSYLQEVEASHRRPLPIFFMGVDPGVGGGISILTDQGKIFKMSPMLTEEGELWELISKFGWNYDNDRIGTLQNRTFAVIEQVQGFIGKRSKKGEGQPGSHMFNFGANYGLCRMALTAARIPMKKVVPLKWQNSVGVPERKKLSDSQWKSELLYRVRQLFPRDKINKQVADSLLLAYYGWKFVDWSSV